MKDLHTMMVQCLSAPESKWTLRGLDAFADFLVEDDKRGKNKRPMDFIGIVLEREKKHASMAGRRNVYTMLGFLEAYCSPVRAGSVLGACSQ